MGCGTAQDIWRRLVAWRAWRRCVVRFAQRTASTNGFTNEAGEAHAIDFCTKSATANFSTRTIWKFDGNLTRGVASNEIQGVGDHIALHGDGHACNA